jgi:hypothetical protein
MADRNDGLQGTDASAIRANIEQTRARMGDTIEAIGERLNPNHLKAELRETVRERVQETEDSIRAATIGRAENMAKEVAHRVNDTSHGIMDTIRENPIPAAMVGIGLGWLFFNGRRGHEHRETYGYAAGERFRNDHLDYRTYDTGYYREATDYTAVAGTEAGTTIGEPGVTERVRERASDVGEAVRDTAGNIADRAQSAASTVRDRTTEVVSDVASGTRHLAGNVAHRTRDVANRAGHVVSDLAHGVSNRAHSVEDRVSTAFNDSPLAVGAVALALGIAAGMAVPGTRFEDERLGATRDRLLDRAEDAARETGEKIQRVASDVVEEARETARESARDEGLVS